MSITKEEVWEMFREVARRSQETERMLQENAREAKERSAELDRKIKEITQSIGRLGNRLGEFVEEMVRPAVVRIFQARGIAVHEVHRRVSSKRDGEEMEVDLLVVNDTDAVAIEVKSELSVADVKEHVERMARFKKMFPHYRGFNVMGAVAAMVVPEDVAKFAYRQGLFVLGQSGESVEIRNGLDFQPAVW